MTQHGSRAVTILLVASIAAMVAVLLVVGAGGTVRSATISGLVLVAIGALFVFAMIAAAASRARRRRQQLIIQRVVDEIGVEYQPKTQEALHRDLAPLPGIPRGGVVTDVLTGQLEQRQFVAFQHMYMVHTGQASIPVYHTVYATVAPGWPSVTARPRGFLARLQRRFGSGRGLLLDDPAFNQSFRVVTGDEDFALLLLSPEMQRFMLTHRKVSWQVGSGKVAMVYPGAMKFDRIKDSIERLRLFWQLVPDELDAW